MPALEATKTSSSVRTAAKVSGSFGEFSILLLGDRDNQAETNWLVTDGVIKPLPRNQPFSLKGRLRPFLEAKAGGSIIYRMLIQKDVACAWETAPGLDTSSLHTTDKKAPIASPVHNALGEIAQRLTGLINQTALRTYGFDVLNITDADYAEGFVRNAPEWEAFNDEAALDNQSEALGVLFGIARIELEDLLKLLSLEHLELTTFLESLPEKIQEPGQRLRYRLDSYGTEAFVVKPRYRAVSGLVQEAAIRQGIPALQDAAEGAQSLWLSGDPTAYCSTLEVLVIPDLALVNDLGDTICPVGSDITLRWSGWPNRERHIAKSWHSKTRPQFENALQTKRVGGLTTIRKEDFLARVAASAEWIAYTIERFAESDQNVLNWHRYVVVEQGAEILRLGSVRSGVLLSLVGEFLGDDAGSQPARLLAVSNALQQMADEIENLSRGTLSLASELGTGDASVDAIRRPLLGALTAMRAATPERLAGGEGAVELMLTALVASSDHAATHILDPQ